MTGFPRYIPSPLLIWNKARHVPEHCAHETMHSRIVLIKPCTIEAVAEQRSHRPAEVRLSIEGRIRADPGAALLLSLVEQTLKPLLLALRQGKARNNARRLLRDDET